MSDFAREHLPSRASRTCVDLCCPGARVLDLGQLLFHLRKDFDGVVVLDVFEKIV